MILIAKMITSAVEMMKVTVEIRTMESENRARNWARLEVQGYLLQRNNDLIKLIKLKSKVIVQILRKRSLSLRSIAGTLTRHPI